MFVGLLIVAVLADDKGDVSTWERESTLHTLTFALSLLPSHQVAFILIGALELKLLSRWKGFMSRNPVTLICWGKQEVAIFY